MKLEKGLAALAKLYMWPFTSKIQKRNDTVLTNSFSTQLKMKFQNRLPAVDVTIIRPKEELVFANVRIPFPLSLFAPLKAGQNNNLFGSNHFGRAEYEAGNGMSPQQEGGVMGLGVSGGETTGISVGGKWGHCKKVGAICFRDADCCKGAKCSWYQRQRFKQNERHRHCFPDHSR